MTAHTPALPIELDPLIAEAKQRARRRRLIVLVAAGLVAAGVLAGTVGVSSSGSGGQLGAVPWLPTRPDIGPVHPPLAPACTASQLKAILFLQGATGNLAGGIQLVNRSSHPCALVGRPSLSFVGEPGWRVGRWHQGPIDQYDPLAPSMGSLRALPPGEHVGTQLWIPGCFYGAPSSTSSWHALVLNAPGGGTIRLKDGNTQMGLPSCGTPTATRVQAMRFKPFVAQGKPSSELPLKATIVSGPSHVFEGKKIRDPMFVARAGSWLSFTVVLKNHSRHVFRFGKTCPSYVEGFEPLARDQAYVLNCHAVGSIGPWKSVRFAMRVHVPRHLTETLPAFGWSLAPHSYNASSALAVVQVR